MSKQHVPTRVELTPAVERHLDSCGPVRGLAAGPATTWPRLPRERRVGRAQLTATRLGTEKKPPAPTSPVRPWLRARRSRWRPRPSIVASVVQGGENRGAIDGALHLGLGLSYHRGVCSSPCALSQPIAPAQEHVLGQRESQLVGRAREGLRGPRPGRRGSESPSASPMACRRESCNEP
jgi:hypothetical protein